jgi:hypothetical protein
LWGETFSTPALSASILSAMPTPLLQRQSMRGFIIAILLVGILRFVLTVAGLPNSIVKFVSMTVVMMIATIYFAVVTETHKERLKSAFLIVVPYMVIELGALGYTWATGQQTIFHAQEYSFGMPMSYHFFGHLVGGLTWEPISIFLVMEIIWLILWPFRRNPKPAPELR